MTILHTGDWHLGHTLAGYDRSEEQQQMLNQMVEIVKERQPDVFLLCGDVYHTSQPSAAVQTLFNQTIVRLHDTCPKMVIIVTAGNHDSGTKHEIFRTPWSYLNVYMIGTFDRENSNSHIISIPGKGIVIALPYTHERNLQQDTIQALLDEAQRLNTDSLPIVMSAHTAISGADFLGHEDATEKTVGGIDAINVGDMGIGYDYLALGHIHHQQFVHTGKHNVRYAGSPLPVSFDENYDHSVSIVSIDKHNDTPQVETISIHNLRPLTTLPPNGAATWNEAKEMLRAFPDELPNYIRLNVEISDVLPADARQEALQIAQGKQCRFCVLNVIRRKQEQQAGAHITIQELQRMSPIEVAEMYAKDTDLAFDDDMHKMLENVMNELKENEL